MILGSQLKNAILSGSNNISKYKKQINELNIFPVPDGDTGTNMSMTITAAAEAMEALEDAAPPGRWPSAAASAMLRGARGNSGVILSLLFRGISKGLEGKEEIDAPDLVAALERGVDAAYKAVMKPTEGTILTVARVASRARPGSPGAGQRPHPGVGRRLHGRRRRPGGNPRAAARAEKGRSGGRRRPGPVPDF